MPIQQASVRQCPTGCTGAADGSRACLATGRRVRALVCPYPMLRRPSRSRVTVRTLVVVLTLATASLVLGTWLYSVVP